MAKLNVSQAVKSETSGNFEYALLTILRCAENPAKYFAKVSSHSLSLAGVSLCCNLVIMEKFVTKIISQNGRFMQEGRVNEKPASNVSMLHDSSRDNYPKF